MNKVVVLAIVAVLFIGGAIGALAYLGIWPGPSEADRERAHVLYTEAQVQIRSGDATALATLTESIELAPQNDALRARAAIYISRNDIEAPLH